MSSPIVNLDRPRSLRWSHRADARLGSLERPPLLSDLAHKNARKGFYALCAFVWAALETRDGVADPEEVAAYIGEPVAQAAAWNALRAALEDAGVIAAEKKSDSPATSGSVNGPSPSLNSAQPVPASTT